MLPYAQRYYDSIPDLNLSEEQKENFRQEVKKHLITMESEEDAEFDIRHCVTDIMIENAFRNHGSAKGVAISIML